MMREHPEAYSKKAQRAAERQEAPRSDRVAGADDPAGAARRRGGRVRHRLLERRQPDPGAIGAPRRRAGRAGRARRRPRRAAAHAAGREPGALRRRRRARRGAGAAARRDGQPLCRPLLRPRARRHRRCERALGRRRPGDGRGGAARVRAAPAVAARVRPGSAWRAAASGSRRAPTAGCGCSRRRRSRFRSCCSPARACCSRRSSPCRRRAPATTCGRCWRSTSRRRRPASAIAKTIAFYQEATRRIGALPGVEGVAVGSFVPWRDAGSIGPGVPVHRRRLHARRRRGESARRGCAWSRRASSPCSASRSLAGRDFTDDDRRGSEPVAIVSQSVAQRLFPNGDAVNRHM